MDISVTEAKSLLTDLVKRAEAGEEIVLTRHGHPAARLVPVPRKSTPDSRWAIMQELRGSAAAAAAGPDAAHSQDFLYDPDTGLPT